MGYSPAMEELMETRPISAPPVSQPEISTPVRIYTDGSILKNPGGAGGWAMVATRGISVVEVKSGGVPVSTNNRMELVGVIEAMRWIDYATFTGELEGPAEIISDSEYVVKGLNEYMPGWKLREWRKVKNLDLWHALDGLFNEEFMSLAWIKGHAGHRFNELADELAGVAARLVRDHA